ncbi:hypothetical protein EDD69_104217 [Thermolongibacillus altinsuensis]|uniref:Uncharacterized protein n=1 Tax=Thermolongibacillus altinsuensis TaxID=575256 RepID=A0A4R1QGQ6_9BACL|nr:hypothetical protein [Thermolongibacillus altinsuensis]TCL51162.1 hypothetical protein EDD69_104217 [Thermolongibacillus altinsuensis]
MATHDEYMLIQCQFGKMDKGRMRLGLFSKRLVISFLVCLWMLYLTEVFTIEAHVISGNGNPGLLMVMFAVFSFLFFGMELWKVLNHMNIAKRGWLFISIGSFCTLIISAVLEAAYVIDLIKQLGGSPSNVNSKIYRFSWINQYTNTFYINAYTYIIFVSSIVFICSIQKMFAKR